VLNLVLNFNFLELVRFYLIFMAILLIHCRRGLFSLTICQDCGHTWDCSNCSAKLTTYESEKVKRLICHQCQSSYTYPQKCPNCDSRKILSKFGGIEELVRILQEEFDYLPLRFDGDQTKIQPVQANSVGVSTRLFDPGIDYANFDQIIFLAAENLFASSDYLTNEEVYKSLAEVFLAAKNSSQIIFDTRKTDLEFFVSLTNLAQKLGNIGIFTLELTKSEKENSINSIANNSTEKTALKNELEPEIGLFQKLGNVESQSLENSNLQSPINPENQQSFLENGEESCKIQTNNPENNLEAGKQKKNEEKIEIKKTENSQKELQKDFQSENRTEIIYTWYNELMMKEAKSRENFRFPPFTNLLLLTTQEINSTKSLESLTAVSNYLRTLQKEIPEISFGKPYEAKFFRRKNKFSHHLLVRYPRQYTKFSRLKTIAQWLSDKYKLQIRLNPRHLF